MSLYFSKHAMERVEERTVLTKDELNNIIDKHLYVKIGTEQKKDRDHLLFYSERDKEFYVMVVDFYDNECITIFPEHYHNKWVISDEHRREAVSLIRNNNQQTVIDEHSPRLHIKFYVYNDGYYSFMFKIKPYRESNADRIYDNHYDWSRHYEFVQHIKKGLKDMVSKRNIVSSDDMEVFAYISTTKKFKDGSYKKFMIPHAMVRNLIQTQGVC